MNEYNNEEKQPIQKMILEALSLIKKGTADEVAMEIMEQRGISSEEGVADLVDETRKELGKLYDEHRVKIVKDNDRKKRYTL